MGVSTDGHKPARPDRVSDARARVSITAASAYIQLEQRRDDKSNSVARVRPIVRCSAVSGECPGSPRGDWHPCERDVRRVRVTQALVRNSIAPASYHAYRTGQQFVVFCRRYGLTAVPASEATLTLFIGHQAGLTVATARQYISAVRRLHLQWGCLCLLSRLIMWRRRCRGLHHEEPRRGSIRGRRSPCITCEL